MGRQGQELDDAAQIAKALHDGAKAVEACDPEGMIAPFLKADNLVMFDWNTPRSRGWDDLNRANLEFVDIVAEPYCRYLEIHPVILSPDAAYTRAVLEAGGLLKDGARIDMTIRSTDIWSKVNDRWLIVHEHNSFPADMKTGKVDFQSKP